MTAMEPMRSQLSGCLLGMAVGDALGLPYEGLSPARARRLLGPADRYRLLPGCGLVSDDTEHACMVAQALIAAGQDSAAFQRDLARRMRWWLLGVPAGVGLATLRSILRLWFGVPPGRSGVFSAGNGPAMRGPLLGVAIGDFNRLRNFVRSSSQLTHTDPRAVSGACIVALAARASATQTTLDSTEVLSRMLEQLDVSDLETWKPLFAALSASLARGETTEAYANELGLGRRGVTGFVCHTVPVVLHAWLSHPDDYASAVQSAIRCGGDADKTAAIVGGIVGARVGCKGIPASWVSGLRDWPRTVNWLERLSGALAESLSTGQPGRPPQLPAWGLLPRNAAFASIVLLHGFRRLLPPW